MRSAVSVTLLMVSSLLLAKCTFGPDTARPVIDITSHSQGDTIVTSTFTVSGNVSDSGSGIDTVICDGKRATISTGTYSCEYTRPNGHYLLLVEAWDHAGNSKLVYVGVNVSAPEVESPSPPEPAEFKIPPLPDDPKEAALVLLRKIGDCLGVYPDPDCPGRPDLDKLWEMAVELDPTLQFGEEFDLQNLPTDSKAAARDTDPAQVAHRLYVRALGCEADCAQRALLERAIELDPSLAEAYQLLASMSYSTSMESKRNALDVCRRMQAALPRDPRSYLCLYDFVRALGEKAPEDPGDLLHKAIEMSHMASELDPKYSAARRTLGRRLFEMYSGGKRDGTGGNEGDLTEAIAQYRIGMSLNPMTADLDEFVGRDIDFIVNVASIGHRYREAAEMVVLSVENSRGSLHRWCYFFAARFLEADFSSEPDFQPAIEKIRQHCENPDVIRAIGLEREGNAREAITVWESLYEIEIFRFDALAHMMKLYRQVGESEKAYPRITGYFENTESSKTRCSNWRYLRSVGKFPPELHLRLKEECEAPHQ